MATSQPHPLTAERAAVVRAGRQLLATGLVRGTSGNVSLRLGEAVAVSPTGVPYEDLTPPDVPVVDLAGQPLAGTLRPTSELALHLAVYRARPDVAAIVHTHSMFATVFAVLGEPIPPVHYQLARVGPVGVAPYFRYGSEELAAACVAALGDSGAALLANHGVVAVGADLAAAMAAAESVEYVAELAWRCRLAGGERVLDGAQLAAAAEAFRGYGQA
ncbi:MAG TPA: class II aldolase/adducin family protein [Jatrophihabitans sp.]|nr:class II aldolase/adducin family protein [Jatrophihabitans sp.]